MKFASGLGLQLCGTVSKAGDLSESESETERDRRSLPVVAIDGELFAVKGQRDEAEAGGKQLMSPTLLSNTLQQKYYVIRRFREETALKYLFGAQLTLVFQ